MPCKIPIVTPSIIYFSLTGKFRFFTPAFWPTPVLEKILLLPVIFIVVFTACAVATSSCISDVRSQWEGRNFDPPQLPHFSTDLNETQNQERHPVYDLACNILVDVGRRKGGLRREGIFRYFLCTILFLYFCSRLQVTPEDRSRPLMAQNACFRVR